MILKKGIKNKSVYQRGMTYIELIVVLSIFAVMSSVVIFNTGGFQAKVDVNNLSSDMALRIVGAQKSSLSGILPPVPTFAGWKPSYGVYFRANDPKNFIYFADVDSNKLWEGIDCTGECLSKTTIAKGDTISRLDAFYRNNLTPQPLADLTITFTRPDSGATIRSSTSFTGSLEYVQMTVTSPKGPQARILLYPSGRIEVK